MKVLLLGSTGLLGHILLNFLSTKKIDLILPKLKDNKKKFYLKSKKDFQFLKKIILEKKPNYIINCIAIKNKNLKKKIYINFDLINTKLPIFLSKLCLKNKIYFIHISTDSVFSGSKGNFVENDIKIPTDIYSLSKKNGEVKNKFTTTLRTSFVGPEKKTKKDLFNWYLSRRRQVNGFANFYFTGLTSLEFCEIIYNHFIKKNNLFNKVINIGGKKISKYDLFCIISKIFKKKIIIKKEYYPQIDRSLNNNKFIKLSNYKVKNWVTMLKNLKVFMDTNNYKY